MTRPGVSARLIAGTPSMIHIAGLLAEFLREVIRGEPHCVHQLGGGWVGNVVNRADNRESVGDVTVVVEYRGGNGVDAKKRFFRPVRPPLLAGGVHLAPKPRRVEHGLRSAL